MSTSPFWLNDPRILLKRDEISQIWPTASMSSEQKLNAISRLVIFLTLLGYLLTQKFNIIVTGIVTLVVIIILQRAQATRALKGGKKEAFTNPKLYKLMKHSFTNPTEKNPAMNVLLPEIQYDPKRKSAAPAFNPVVEEEINKETKKMIEKSFGDPNIGEKLFKDLGDNFQFDQSMRSWYATPNTQIPNDQKAFAEFCFGDMISCKEGNEFACTRDNPRWTNP